MRVLLTGGAGYIGSFIIEELVNRGYEVVVFDISIKDISAKKGKIKYIKGDIFDTGSIEDVVSECDVVIHMIGLPHVPKAQSNPMLSFKLNIQSVQHILEAMRRKDVDRIIFPSSSAVYGITENIPVKEWQQTKPNTTYGYHKLIAEELIKSYKENYGITYTILRLFNVYGGPKAQGVLNIFVERAKAGEPIVIYGGEQLRDFVYVTDVSRIIVDSLKIENTINEIINVGTGKGRTINEIAELVREFFPGLEIIRKSSSGREYNSIADITKLKKIFGFAPDSSIETMKNAIKGLIEYDVST